jgi:hypothetical protein
MGARAAELTFVKGTQIVIRHPEVRAKPASKDEAAETIPASFL